MNKTKFSRLSLPLVATLVAVLWLSPATVKADTALYVTDLVNFQVTEYDSSGNLIGTLNNGMGITMGLAVNSSGNLSAKGTTLTVVSIGAILGGMFGPLLGGRIGRRYAYFGLCLGSLVACQIMFRTMDHYDWRFLAMAGVVGCLTASFYGWLPLYLPELFPTRVRATAQGLSYNFGRIFAMFGVLEAGRLMQLFDGSYPRACATISLVYLVGMAVIWLGPETKGKPLPD